MFPMFTSQRKYVYPLDIISATPLMAFSIRKLLSSYTGACLRVRRSSDNTQLDIGFIGASLDAAALITFVGSGSGYIVTYYDQSGNGNHGTQSNAALQLRIINAGVAEVAGTFICPHLYTDGVNLQTPSLNLGTTERSSFFVNKTVQNTIYMWPTSGNGTNQQSYYDFIAPDSYAVNTQGSQAIVNVSIANTLLIEQKTLRFGLVSQIQELWRNGILLGSNTKIGGGYSGTSDSINLGFPLAAPYSNGYLLEFVHFISAISDADKSAYEQNTIAFFGI